MRELTEEDFFMGADMPRVDVDMPRDDVVFAGA